MPLQGHIVWQGCSMQMINAHWLSDKALAAHQSSGKQSDNQASACEATLQQGQARPVLQHLRIQPMNRDLVQHRCTHNDTYQMKLTD